MMRTDGRPTPIVSGLILAGGASSRFGETKPLAALRGRALVRWVASALAPVCDELLISIGVGDDECAFQEAVPEAELVRDLRGDRGPIEGIHRGFLASRGELVAVAPSDAPLLGPDLHASLLRILGDHEVAVPRPRVLDPVRAVYRRDAALRAIREDRLVPSPSALVDRLDAVFLEGEALRRADPSLASFIDVNRREDLERAARAAVAVVG